MAKESSKKNSKGAAEAEDTQISLKKEKESSKPAVKENAKAAPAKAKKENSQAAKKKEPGKIRKWFKDLRIEFKKVVWPTKKTVVNNTSVVVGVITLSAIIVGSLDEGFLALFRAIYH